MLLELFLTFWTDNNTKLSLRGNIIRMMWPTSCWSDLCKLCLGPRWKHFIDKHVFLPRFWLIGCVSRHVFSTLGLGFRQIGKAFKGDKFLQCFHKPRLHLFSNINSAKHQKLTANFFSSFNGNIITWKISWMK